MLDENEKLFLGAIRHIRNLERSVQQLRQEVQRDEAAAAAAEAAGAGPADGLPVEDDGNSSATVIDPCQGRHSDTSSGILDFQGRRMETNVYKLDIVCTKENDVFHKLVQAIEMQTATIMRAQFSSWNNEMHGTYIVQAPAWENLSMDDVRNQLTQSLTTLTRS